MNVYTGNVEIVELMYRFLDLIAYMDYRMGVATDRVMSLWIGWMYGS